MRKLALIIGLTAASGLTSAQGAYRWVDEQGKVHYGDRPPVSKTVKTQELKLAAPEADKALPTATREAMRDYPVTLYITADCGAPCVDGRNLLKKRNIPYTEKPVGSAEDLAALKKLVGSEDILVPVLQVGGQISKSYLESAWTALLDAAGYPKDAKP